MNRGSSPQHEANGWMPWQEALGAISDGQIAGLRVFLAMAGLVAIYIDPTEPDRFARLTHTSLIFYAIYSGGIYVAALYRGAFTKRVNVSLVGADVLVYSLLVSLSSGTNSIFYFYYFFVILVACGRLGANAGLAVTVITALLFTLSSLFAAPQGTRGWNRLFLRPIVLMSLGYVVTYWSRVEYDLRRKLEVLRAVSLTSNPRFGVDRTSSLFMQRVLEFFKAETCVLLEYERNTETYRFRCATARDPEAGIHAVPAPDDIRAILQATAGEDAVLCTDCGKLGKPNEYWICGIAGRTVSKRKLNEDMPLVEWLGRSFMVAPMRHHEWLRGYLFISTERPGAFRLEDARFMLQLVDQVTPVLEHIRLVDRMATGAAEEERRKIARSVHDRVIQPYIGMQMGLRGLRHLMQTDAAQRRATASTAEENRQVLQAVDQLIDMTGEGVEDLRRYVYGLRKATVRRDLLMESLLRYAEKFETATGIRITVANRVDVPDLNDRLASEIFQIVLEALSNVQRHTTAKAVTLIVENNPNGHVAVRIENEGQPEGSTHDFVPGSITEGAESLGGHAQVSNADGRTIVQIEIPL